MVRSSVHRTTAWMVRHHHVVGLVMMRLVRVLVVRVVSGLVRLVMLLMVPGLLMVVVVVVLMLLRMVRVWLLVVLIVLLLWMVLVLRRVMVLIMMLMVGWMIRLMRVIAPTRVCRWMKVVETRSQQRISTLVRGERWRMHMMRPAVVLHVRGWRRWWLMMIVRVLLVRLLVRVLLLVLMMRWIWLRVVVGGMPTIHSVIVRIVLGWSRGLHPTSILHLLRGMVQSSQAANRSRRRITPGSVVWLRVRICRGWRSVVMELRTKRRWASSVSSFSTHNQWRPCSPILSLRTC